MEDQFANDTLWTSTGTTKFLDRVLLIKCCLQKCQFYAIRLAKTSDTQKILDLIWMKILNSDSQCDFRIILVEKLRFVRPNWNI